MGTGWETETHCLNIQSLREESVSNPFGDDYERVTPDMLPSAKPLETQTVAEGGKVPSVTDNGGLGCYPVFNYMGIPMRPAVVGTPAPADADDDDIGVWI